jgi:hypothetical protein
MPSACPVFDELQLLFETQSSDCQVVDLSHAGFRALLLDEECECGPFITYHKILRVETAAGKLVQFVTLESNPGSDRQYLCVQTAKMHQRTRQILKTWTTATFVDAARELLATTPVARPKKSRKSK